MSSALRRIDTSVNGGTVGFAGISAVNATLITVSGRGVMLTISSSFDQPVILTLDAGAHDFMTLAPGKDITLNLGSNTCEFSGSVRVREYNATPPTAGIISCGVVRVL